MRWLVFAIVLLPTSAFAQELKSFDFMGFTAGDVVPAEKIKKCSKGETVTCIFPLAKVSNVYAGYLVTLYQGKLSTVYVDAHPNSYPDLLQAFTLKYGEPCERSSNVWKNAAGAQLENPTFRWCFKTGKLLFSRYGSRIDKMAIFYQDENGETIKPKVNF